MGITHLEKEQLLKLYKEETGNPIVPRLFKLTDYLEWIEQRLITFLNQ